MFPTICTIYADLYQLRCRMYITHVVGQASLSFILNHLVMQAVLIYICIETLVTIIYLLCIAETLPSDVT